jgi:hypothetical protein
MALKKTQQSLKTWTGQDWTTASGKKSSNRKKRAATRKGKQYAKHGLHKGKRR